MSIGVTRKPKRRLEKDLVCVATTEAFLGEGPHWDLGDRRLYWVDILEPSLHITSPVSGEDKATPLDELCGVIVPRQSGGFVAATKSGFDLVDPLSGSITRFAAPEENMSNIRFNDGKCDSQGRFWAGTLALDASPGAGSLYRLDIDGSIAQIETGFDICNGLGWSPDGDKFYLADSGVRAIYQYQFDADKGQISDRQTLVQFHDDEGIPDGLAVDSDGFIWCAVWDGWRVVRFSPEGLVDRVIEMPVPRPTSCAFGGDDLSTLFITSARIRLSAAQLAEAPLSGAVFSIDVGTPGVPVNSYQG